MAVTDTLPAHRDSEGLTRRNLFMALPALGAAASMPSLALAEGEDPILLLYRQWVAARKEWYSYADLPGNEDWDMPESLRAAAQEDAAFYAMLEMTPISVAGVAALVHVLWDFIGPVGITGTEEYLKRAEQPDCKMMGAIWRYASGQQSLPPNGKMEDVA